MAQHYPTKEFKQKRFRVIENGIDYAFNKSRGLMKTSMQFDYIGVQGGNEVYLTTRKIPKGIMAYGIEEGSFEVHYSTASRKIVEIYLIA